MNRITITIALAVALLFGIAPAASASTPAPQERCAESERGERVFQPKVGLLECTGATLRWRIQDTPATRKAVSRAAVAYLTSKPSVSQVWCQMATPARYENVVTDLARSQWVPRGTPAPVADEAARYGLQVVCGVPVPR